MGNMRDVGVWGGKQDFCGPVTFRGPVTMTGSFSHGLPLGPGKTVYVDPAYGTDGGSGTDMRRPLKSLSAAYTECRSGKGDNIIIFDTGITAASTVTTVTTALTWAKWGITVIGYGNGEGTQINTTSSLATAMLIVTGSRNKFYGLRITNAGATSAAGNHGKAVHVIGADNLFVDCHFEGGAVTNSALLAAMFSLCIGWDAVTAGTCKGNRFVRCTIGTSAVTRAAAVAGQDLLFEAGAEAGMNQFIDCSIIAIATGIHANYNAIRIGDATSFTRPQIFRGCWIGGADAPFLTLVAIGGAAPTTVGDLFFMNCCFHSAADVCEVAISTSVYTMNATPNARGGQAVVMT